MSCFPCSGSSGKAGEEAAAAALSPSPRPAAKAPPGALAILTSPILCANLKALVPLVNLLFGSPSQQGCLLITASDSWRFACICLGIKVWNLTAS